MKPPLTDRKRLTKEQKDYISQHYVELGPSRIAKTYNELFGTSHNVRWFKSAANRLGLSMCESPPGWYSVAEVSYLFGTSNRNIQKRIENGTINGKRFGKRKYFIHEDEIPKIQAWYAASKQKLPWPALTTAQAADMLGILQEAICRIARTGSIDAIKCGKNYMVRKSHIEWGYQQMKQHGFVNIPWYKMRERLQK